MISTVILTVRIERAQEETPFDQLEHLCNDDAPFVVFILHQTFCNDKFHFEKFTDGFEESSVSVPAATTKETMMKCLSDTV